MADPFVASHLKRFPLFARLTPPQLEAVANAAQVMRYQPGEVIFAQGQPATGAVIFASGRGELTQTGPDGVTRQVGLVNAGEYLNESALFSDVVAPITLRATETSIILFLSRQQMASVLAYYPDIKDALQAQPLPAGSRAVAPTPSSSFRGQRENENIVIATRRHWWVFVRSSILTLLVIVILFLIGSIASSGIPSFPWAALIGPALLIAACFVVYFYLEWRNDEFIITEYRVINIQRNILSISTNINELPLDAILEVRASVPVTDIPARIFGYGTIVLKTAGEGPGMRLDYVPQPRHIQEMIFTQRERVRQNLVTESQNAARIAIRGDIDKFLGRTPQGEAASGGQPVTRRQEDTGFLTMKYVNERGETVYRKHWIVWMQHVMLPSVLILVGLVLFALASFGISQLGFIGFALAFAVVLMGAVWFYLADWDWRHDLYIIGDQTITLIHKRPLWLQDENDQILLSQVDNVVSFMSGIIGNLLRVGSVRISLVGSDEQNAKWFQSVHEPQVIQQEISRRQDRAGALKQDAEAQRQKQAILDYLSVYHETVAPGASAQSSSPGAPPSASNPAADQPPKVRDRTRPPGIPLVKRDDHPPKS